MNALAPFSVLDESLRRTESLLYKLNPKYLSRIKAVSPDIFDFGVLDLVQLNAYNIFWKYLAHGAIYSSQDTIVLRTFDDIRVFSSGIDQVKCVIYRRDKERLEKGEARLSYKEFYEFLDGYIRDYTDNIEPLHEDLLTTRYYETLPIDITVTKAAFDQFEKLGLLNQVYLFIKADIDDVITVLPAFFNRLHALFVHPSILEVHSLVAPVLSNRRAVHMAKNTLKATENERTVKSTTGMQKIKTFCMKDMHVKLNLGNNSYVFSPNSVKQEMTSFLRIFIDFSGKLPIVILEVQDLDSRL